MKLIHSHVSHTKRIVLSIGGIVVLSTSSLVAAGITNAVGFNGRDGAKNGSGFASYGVAHSSSVKTNTTTATKTTTAPTATQQTPITTTPSSTPAPVVVKKVTPPVVVTKKVTAPPVNTSAEVAATAKAQAQTTAASPTNITYVSNKISPQVASTIYKSAGTAVVAAMLILASTMIPARRTSRTLIPQKSAAFSN